MYKGIEFFVEDLKMKISVRGLLICGTADLPAKALFLSMNQYNGRFGCQICLQEGGTVDRTRVYPFTENIILRTEQNILECSVQALDIGKPVCGVKGPSIMSKICHNFITGTAVDAMHCIFEGVVRKLGELWFDAKYANETFNISNFIEIIDKKLCDIKPPSFISRNPRSIKDHFSYWKASELKNWFFYFSLPVLRDVLPEDYFNHYKYIVWAIYLLFQEKCTDEMIDLAKSLIYEFTSRFEYLYGEKHITCNIHSVNHLPTIVRRLGPLWTTSCFALEDLNGKIKALVHGSKKPELQIFFNLNLYVKVYTLKHEWLKENTDAYDFCDYVSSPQKRLKLTKLENKIYAVGTVKKIKMPDSEVIIRENNLQGKNVYWFQKLYKNKLLYTSESAPKNQKSESFYVTFTKNTRVYVGKIIRYIHISNCSCNKF